MAKPDPDSSDPDSIADSTHKILKVAVPSPLRCFFDYLPPENIAVQALHYGARVVVPFGRRQQVGVVVDSAATSNWDSAKLKRIVRVLDDTPLLTLDILTLLQWASHYYQFSPGEVISAGLPTLLRSEKAPSVTETIYWLLTPAAQSVEGSAFTNAPRQLALMQLLSGSTKGMSEQAINEVQSQWRPSMKRLLDKGLVERVNRSTLASVGEASRGAETIEDNESYIALNHRQTHAVQTVCSALGRFQPFLLEGVTGSGKTEVYLRIIDAAIALHCQALVLVPEIGLTPQLIARFQSRFQCAIAVLHSGLSDRERLQAWLLARHNKAGIVIGTRSAITTPMPQLGVIIVDEEHDSSFKQQEGFRYSARDMAIVRAKNAGIPIVLGSATPSLESIYNHQQKRYQLLELPERVGAAIDPDIQVIDVRSQTLQEGMSQQLLLAMREHLAEGAQVLLFINRRGFAPTLLCHDCGWVARCQRCDSHMTYHHGRQRLRCHHCGSERRAENACPECSGTSLVPLGEGTERIEQAINERFNDVGVVRIDRDTTRRKGALEAILSDIHSGKSRILIGTQMLSKGHHFPNVTLVGILNVDHGLFSVDFRAMEKMAQLVMQVAGRAGRAEKPGRVLIQSHYPEHPLLQILIQKGYAHFARQALQERKAAVLPPYSHAALLRAEAVDMQLPQLFLTEAKQLAFAHQINGVELLGPIPAPMEKRAGRYRAQLFIQSSQRRLLHQLLTPWLLQLEKSKVARKVRWSIDVDPVDIY